MPDAAVLSRLTRRSASGGSATDARRQQDRDHVRRGQYRRVCGRLGRTAS